MDLPHPPSETRSLARLILRRDSSPPSSNKPFRKRGTTRSEVENYRWYEPQKILSFSAPRRKRSDSFRGRGSSISPVMTIWGCLRMNESSERPRLPLISTTLQPPAHALSAAILTCTSTWKKNWLPLRKKNRLWSFPLAI